MSRSIRMKLSGVFLFLLVCASIPLASFIIHHAAQAATPSSLPYHEFANGPYTVSGNQIKGADGTQYLFHGVGRDGLEFECNGDAFLDVAHLGLMGPGTSGSGNTYWWGNTVRLPLSEGFWLHGNAAQSCTAASYQTLVKKVVDTLTSLKLNVIIDLMWVDAGGQSGSGGAGFDMADNDSLTFWTQVAGIYKGYSNVLFELYNEPHPTTWTCWKNPCTITDSDTLPKTTLTYQGVGVQALVNTVRATGATNVALVAGMVWGFDLSQLATNPITDSANNLAYDTHPYNYPNKQPSSWDAAFGNLTATKPVMSTESGEYDCNTTFMNPLLTYFDAHQMGWIGWSWFSVGSACGYPQLITDYNGTPAASMGTLLYQHMLSYAGQVPPTPTPVPSLGGPVNSTWYFAEGRAGGGFKEWLTLENPNGNLCTVNIEYLAQQDGNHPPFTKNVTVNLPRSSRVTQWVDGDLGTSTTGVGISNSSIITVTNSSVCPGIVAERPMYFNALGTNSGSDTIGITHLNTTFYFGDLAEGGQPGGGNYSSFITILNPPSASASATVTATYYAGGKPVATQNVVVAAGTRGTIFPNQAKPGLPSHVAVVVTSTSPVAVERPTYFSNINGGSAGTVSGAADVVGVQTLKNDWLFAEGFTGAGFQENFVISNVDPTATANVTINLDLSNGSVKTYPVSVKPESQVIWNVNAFQNGQALSADISSTGANIMVEREMFFKYSDSGRGLSSMGGSDVLGQPGPAAASNYSFAEGFADTGYDEWLTIQNPTGSTENITISIVNQAGNYYSTTIQVNGHTRATVSITGMVINHLYKPGENFTGFENSMVVQSASGPFVAERPMYWNATGTQGGSDVIGYIGG